VKHEFIQKKTSPVGSKAPRYRIMASYFSKAEEKVASLLRPTMNSLKEPSLLAFFISSAKPEINDIVILTRLSKCTKQCQRYVRKKKGEIGIKRN